MMASGRSRDLASHGNPSPLNSTHEHDMGGDKARSHTTLPALPASLHSICMLVTKHKYRTEN